MGSAWRLSISQDFIDLLLGGIPLSISSPCHAGDGNSSGVVRMGDAYRERLERMSAGWLFFQSNHHSSRSVYLGEFRWILEKRKGIVNEAGTNNQENIQGTPFFFNALMLGHHRAIAMGSEVPVNLFRETGGFLGSPAAVDGKNGCVDNTIRLASVSYCSDVHPY